MKEKLINFFTLKKYQSIKEQLHENERRVNILVFVTNWILITSSIFYIAHTIVLNQKYFDGDTDTYLFKQIYFLASGLIFNLIINIVGLILKFKKPILKYLFILSLLVNSTLLSIGGEAILYLLLILPIVFSVGYCNSSLTLLTGIISIGCFIGSFFIANVYGIVDYNSLTYKYDEITKQLVVDYDEERYLYNRLIGVFIPNLLAILLSYFICMVLTIRSANVLLKEHESTVARSYIENEIKIAKGIQESLTPLEPISNDNIEITGVMKPAKEIGGDFFDYFYIDDKHVAFLIGDVSGKGIPSSLFAATISGYIKTYAKNLKDPKRVFEETNNALTEVNRERLFATAWFGILDLTNGDLVYTNAGHNPPFYKERNKDFIQLDCQPNFVLGIKKHISYSSHHVSLKENEKMFLYTDGISEAMNKKNELYSIEKLENLLKEIGTNSCKEIIKNVEDSVSNFAEGNSQYDDITMVLFEYKNLLGKEITNKTFLATQEDYPHAQNFILNYVKSKTKNEKIFNDLGIVFDEIFSNISNYSQNDNSKHTEVNIHLDFKKDKIIIDFLDNGVKFNPLEVPDPNIKENAKEHKIGGLGIFMAKNLVNDMTYEYIGNKNKLTIIKKIK